MITGGFLLGTVNAPCSQRGELFTLSCITRATDREALLLICGLFVYILYDHEVLKKSLLLLLKQTTISNHHLPISEFEYINLDFFLTHVLEL